MTGLAKALEAWKADPMIVGASQGDCEYVVECSECDAEWTVGLESGALSPDETLRLIRDWLEVEAQKAANRRDACAARRYQIAAEVLHEETFFS